METSSDGMNIMLIGRIPSRTQKIHEKILQLQNFFKNQLQTTSYLNHETFFCSKEIGQVCSPMDLLQDKGKHIRDWQILG
jgi:hypothetical protein